MKLLRKSEQDETSAHQPAKGPGRELLMERGLYAEWYVGLRLDEEIARATRYERPLSVLIAQAHLLPGERLRREVLEAVIKTTGEIARGTDIVGWLGDNRIVFILPETDPGDARVAALRWRNEMWRRSQHVGGQQWDLLVCDDWSHEEQPTAGVEAALARAMRVEAA